MPNFQFKRITKTYRQVNNAVPAKVFPLLCPVMEKEWIDGWEYELVYSKTGVAELGCIFSTPAVGGNKTTWYISKYDPERFIIEFVRMTPGEMVVKIFIQLSDGGNGTTISDILYEYTALSEAANVWIDKQADTTFLESMHYWENALNHYLHTGHKLLKS